MERAGVTPDTRAASRKARAGASATAATSVVVFSSRCVPGASERESGMGNLMPPRFSCSLTMTTGPQAHLPLHTDRHTHTHALNSPCWAPRGVLTAHSPKPQVPAGGLHRQNSPAEMLTSLGPKSPRVLETCWPRYSQAVFPKTSSPTKRSTCCQEAMVLKLSQGKVGWTKSHRILYGRIWGVMGGGG